MPVSYDDPRYTYDQSSPYEITYDGALKAPLAGTQPVLGSPGVLTWKIAHHPRLTGIQPVPTGALVARKGTIPRALAGAQPFATGLVTRRQLLGRLLTGAQPASSGLLAIHLTIHRRLTGDQPSATGQAAGHHVYHVSLSGFQPVVGYDVLYNDPRFTYNDGAITYNFSIPTHLTWRVFYLRVLTGEQPFPTGELIYGRTVWPWAIYYNPTVTDRPEEIHYILSFDSDENVEYEVRVNGEPDGVVYRELAPTQAKEPRLP